MSELRASVSVVSPALTLDIALEADASDDERIHLHPAGQGFWVARMVSRLGGAVTLCAPLGGEPGRALKGLVEAEGIELVDVDLDGWSAVRVSRGRAGAETTLARTGVRALTRHEVDDLYGLALTTGLSAGVSVLTGSPEDVVEPDFFRRLAHDVRANGGQIVCDLSGEDLRSAVAGGVNLAKIAAKELHEGGWARTDDEAGLMDGIRRLHDGGAEAVVLSRAEAPAILSDGTNVVHVESPAFVPHHHRGAGDSMTAAIAWSLARGHGLEHGIRIAAAAGALNVTRSGLGTGDRRAIDRLAARVLLRDVGRHES